MRKHQTDKRIFIATFILILIGTIMVSIIGPSYTNIQNIAYGRNDDPNQTFRSQILYVILAFLTMIFFLKLPLKQTDSAGSKQRKVLKITSKLPEFLMFGSLTLCLLMFISALTVKLPFVGCALGACRWLNLGFLQLQVAELVKFGALFYFAKICTEYREAGGFSGRKTEELRRGDIDLRNIKNYQNKIKTRMQSTKKQKSQVENVIVLIKDFFKKKDGYAFWVKYVGTLLLAVFFLVVAQKDLGSALPLIAMALGERGGGKGFFDDCGGRVNFCRISDEFAASTRTSKRFLGG